LKIFFNVILPSTPRSSKWYISIRVPNQNSVCTSPVSRWCYKPLPYYSSWFDRPTNIRRGTQIMKFRTAEISPVLSFFKLSCSTPYSRMSSACVFSLMQETKFRTHVKLQAQL
jgi:hypothetical protein